MLTQRSDATLRFTRRDAGRLAIASAVLVILLTGILALDIMPQRVDVEVPGQAVPVG